MCFCVAVVHEELLMNSQAFQLILKFINYNLFCQIHIGITTVGLTPNNVWHKETVFLVNQQKHVHPVI